LGKVDGINSLFSFYHLLCVDGVVLLYHYFFSPKISSMGKRTLILTSSLVLFIGSVLVVSPQTNNSRDAEHEVIVYDGGPPGVPFDQITFKAQPALKDAVLPWLPTVSYKCGFLYASLSAGYLAPIAPVIRGPTADKYRC
jgi:hypothetical protein